ncbi:MAG: hypothetical protein RMJ66_05960 [Bacteroidia bacterium]|nr:YbjN domain-containing protein [Bacteroidia bacterium]MDW8134595.1 hypothetical protein [Bacteroidia bacterium]
MHRHLLYFVYLIGLITVGKGFLSAQNPKIKSLLDKAGLKYSVDSDGDFKLVFQDEDDKRSQLIFIMSAMETMGEEAIVEIWSPAYRRPEISSEVLLKLLQNSTNRKIGSWEVHKTSENLVAVFKAKIPLSSLTPAFLKAVCIGIATTADDMEEELSPGSDEF